MGLIKLFFIRLDNLKCINVYIAVENKVSTPIKLDPPPAQNQFLIGQKFSAI